MAGHMMGSLLSVNMMNFLIAIFYLLMEITD